MTDLKIQKHKINPERFTLLAPVPPFVDQILICCAVSRADFPAILKCASSYPNDPRLIEMVRKAGDASAKVPYLIDYGETPDSILETLREIAAPHIEHIQTLPDVMQATIHSLLSINIVPNGCEAYGIPALLEIDRIQKEMSASLHGLMADRKPAQIIHENNRRALRVLDEEWPTIRKNSRPWPVIQTLPEYATMQYLPIYFRDSLVGIREICVVVDAPDARELKRLTPPFLQSPLPEHIMPPSIGSADWLIRMVGKIGRHFTRALLDIINEHLQAERLHPHLSSQDYEQLNREVQDAVRWYLDNKP